MEQLPEGEYSTAGFDGMEKEKEEATHGRSTATVYSKKGRRGFVEAARGRRTAEN